MGEVIGFSDLVRRRAAAEDRDQHRIEPAAAPGAPAAAPRREVRTAAVAPAPETEPLWREAVGHELRRRRKELGRTLADVAGTSGVSVPYLSEVERGRKEPSSEILAAIGGALGLGLMDLTSLVTETLRIAGAPGSGERPRGPVAMAGVGAYGYGGLRLLA